MRPPIPLSRRARAHERVDPEVVPACGHVSAAGRDLTLAGMAAFERSKRHPRALRADVRREQVRQKATGERHRDAEAAEEMALGLESLA